MGCSYHPVHNNCQKFCNNLEQCILIPRTMQDVKKTLKACPPKAKDIIHRQIWECLLREYYEPESDTSTWTARRLSLLSMDALVIYIVYLCLKRGQKDLYFLFSLAIAVHGWSENATMLRHLQSALSLTTSVSIDLYATAYMGIKPVEIADISQ